MINKKNGFTLIEVLLVVAVMSVIGVIITVNLTSTLNNTHQEDCDNFVNEVEDAACVYVGLYNKEIQCTRSSCDPIKLSLLVREGLIESETDACTGNQINENETVTVSWDATGEKKCTYNGVKVYEK